MPYPIIDVSHWNEDLNAVGYVGEREKVWLLDPERNQLAMLKFPRDDRGEHWAEKLCSEFAKVLGFPCAEVELAIRDGRVSSLSYFFVKKSEGYSHYDGGKYFPHDYDRDRNKGYNFQLIQKVLSEFDLVEDFLYVVVFDALVGNGDRHQDNWGITRHEKSNQLTISPLYDNSACLGRDVTPEKAAVMIESREELLRYIYKGKSKIGWFEKRNEKHFELVRNLIMLYPHQMTDLIQRLSRLTDDQIEGLVRAMPDAVITQTQKEFIILYVRARREILLRMGDHMKNPVTELLMVWKDPEKRQRYVVGVLSQEGDMYSFEYINPELDEAVRRGFVNYPSFPDLKMTYKHQGLFHSIKERLPRPKRPDYLTILERYGLGSHHSEMEILEATRGRTATDTFEFVPKVSFVPHQPFTLDFELASGRRYDLEKVAHDIHVGTKLVLVKEVDNPKDPHAVQVLVQDRTKIGYVPKYFSRAVSDMLDHAGDAYDAVVVALDLQNENPDEWVKIRVTLEISLT